MLAVSAQHHWSSTPGAADPATVLRSTAAGAGASQSPCSAVIVARWEAPPSRDDAV